MVVNICDIFFVDEIRERCVDVVLDGLLFLLLFYDFELLGCDGFVILLIIF